MGIIEAEGTARPVGPLRKPYEYRLKFELVHPDAILPLRAHSTDAGLDLHTVERVGLAAGEQRTISTGVAVEIPTGYVGLVCPRSGLAAKYGITIVNAPGIIDSGYRGELKVVLLNTSPNVIGFNVGDRIAQLVVTPVCVWAPVVVDNLGDADRGEAGFGSSGV